MEQAHSDCPFSKYLTEVTAHSLHSPSGTQIDMTWNVLFKPSCMKKLWQGNQDGCIYVF